MAIYDYWCPQCETEEKEWHGMMEDPIILCKTCGTVKKRLIRAPYLNIPKPFNPDCLD